MCKNMVKAIFFDIDGTLIPFGEAKMASDTLETLRQLQARGIKLFLATGRNGRELDFITDDIRFDGYITLNGQICLDKKGEMFYGNSLHPEDMKKIKVFFEQKEIPIVLIEKDRSYINYVSDAVQKMHEEFHVDPPPVDVYSGKMVYQAIFYADESHARELLKELPHCQMSRWHPYGMDVFSKTGGKRQGIEKTIGRCGIKREEILTFGDGDNDVEMTRFAGIGVAMGNAQDVVKSAADFVTTNAENQGITNAVRHLGLL